MIFASILVVFHLCSVADPSKCADDHRTFRAIPPACGAHYTVNSAELAGLAKDMTLIGPTTIDVTCK